MSDCRAITINKPNKCYCDYDREEILEALGLEEMVTEQTLVDGTTATIAILAQRYKEILDKMPYVFRKSGGGLNIKGATREVDSIVGATVCWNQLASALTSNDWTSNNANMSFADGICTFTATAQGGYVYTKFNTKGRLNHIFLAVAEIKTTTATSLVNMNFWGSGMVYAQESTNWQKLI